VRSALEWAQVRAMAADGVSQRQIAARLGIDRRTVRRVAADGPPRYERALAGSMLDPLEPVIRRLLEEWPQIKAPRVTEILRDDYGYGGSVDLVRKRMAGMRPPEVRAAQRTGYRPGRVMQVDWAEMPTRPKIAGRECRVATSHASSTGQVRRRWRTRRSTSRRPDTSSWPGSGSSSSWRQRTGTSLFTRASDKQRGSSSGTSCRASVRSSTCSAGWIAPCWTRLLRCLTAGRVARLVRN
jgi:transposase